MFGLRNFRGSCWVNTCLQGLFRIPDVQKRYTNKEADTSNPIDISLQTIWNTKGAEGLKEFFDSVKSATLPAGQNIGDSHELLVYLCDKLPWLDALCRFKIANSITCKGCPKPELREDSMIEFSIAPVQKGIALSECISQSVAPYTIDDWICDTCKEKGCSRQLLIGTFPKVMIFHSTNIGEGTLNYPSVINMNSKQYALCSVLCFNGGHWWAYGRDMPPGKSWNILNDTIVREHGPSEFPVSTAMRVLIYYRLDD